MAMSRISGVSLASGQSVTRSYVNDLVSANDDMSEFCEMVLLALGYDIKFADFCKMSKEQRISLARDIKIKRVLD